MRKLINSKALIPRDGYDQSGGAILGAGLLGRGDQVLAGLGGGFPLVEEVVNLPVRDCLGEAGAAKQQMIARRQRHCSYRRGRFALHSQVTGWAASKEILG